MKKLMLAMVALIAAATFVTAGFAANAKKECMKNCNKAKKECMAEAKKAPKEERKDAKKKCNEAYKECKTACKNAPKVDVPTPGK